MPGRVRGEAVSPPVAVAVREWGRQVNQSNIEVVLEFCQRYTAGDWDGLGALLDDDFRWKTVTSGLRQSSAVADAPILNGDPGYTKAETLAVFRQTQESSVDGRFDLIPVAWTAEGDRVALEATSHAVNAANGRVYDNRYHHLFVVRDGLITELREYQDTLHVYDVWIAP
jgi:ketosteroid isomerase-like protein